MKICFCSLLLPNEKELLTKTKCKLTFSKHKFGMNVLEGLEDNLKNDITVMNIINTVNFPKYKQLFFKTQSWSHNGEAEDFHVGYINLFIIKYITQSFSLKRKLQQWVKEQSSDEQLVLLVHDIFYSNIIAALSISKKHKNVKTCLLTGDLSGKYGLAPDCNTIKNIMIRLKDKYISKQIRKFDSFVFVTKYMAQAVGVSSSPSTVTECLYSANLNMLKPINNKNEEVKIIFYAGAIREEYGNTHLLRAFSMIKNENYRLWIAGGGDGVKDIQEYEKGDSRIKYVGFISPKQVDEYQQKATVLINPRTSEHEFVKYSFAGKNMECLASGKPYIAHKLLCNPSEYDEYILYPDNESDEALMDKIIEVCEMPIEEKDIHCKKCRDFILSEKNPTKQCKKIVEMLKEI